MEFLEALSFYEFAIQKDPTNAIFWANKAMANLKLKRFTETISDCSMALKLKPNYTKAYARRASAYLETGCFQSAIQDVRAVLLVEPNNKVAKQLLKQCQSQIHKFSESDNRSLKESVPNSCSKGLAVNPIDGPLTDSVSHPEPLASSSTLSSTITVPESVPAEAPANAFEFQKMWAHLSRSRDLTSLHQFFKLIDPEKYPILISNGLTGDMLSSIVEILYSFFERSDSTIGKMLRSLSKVKRFSIVVNFLREDSNKKLVAILDEMEKSNALSLEEKRELCKLYKI
ncbi:uncharacterized protein LOC135121875 [Zophobas morio]|uniref:uncharacterized protein LOC135121875 n=1 Tax=Zophobas morio TaxID=2755281 RepID=UPI003082869A